MTPEMILCHKTRNVNNQNENLQSSTYSKHDLKNAVSSSPNEMRGL